MKEDNIIEIIETLTTSPTNNLKMFTAIKWINCLQQGKTAFDRLYEHNIEKIVVYGITELGELLVKEAINCNYKVIAITDNRISSGGYEYHGIPMESVKQISKWKNECIVVTAVTFFDEIKDSLLKLGFKKIIPLWDLL